MGKCLPDFRLGSPSLDIAFVFDPSSRLELRLDLEPLDSTLGNPGGGVEGEGCPCEATDGGGEDLGSGCLGEFMIEPVLRASRKTWRSFGLKSGGVEEFDDGGSQRILEPVCTRSELGLDLI